MITVLNRVTRLKTGWRDYLMKHHGSHPKKIDLNRSAVHLPSNKRKFQFIDKGNLRVIKNRRKQAKINIVFYHFPSLGKKKPP